MGHALTIVLGNVVSVSIGVNARDARARLAGGGLVMYFVLVMLVPNLTGLLATSQDWFKDP